MRHYRFIGWTSFVVCALASSLVVHSAGAQAAAGMPPLRFQVRLVTRGAAAVSGVKLSVITARSVSDIVVCGTGVAGADGVATIDLQPVPRCADDGNAGGPVEYIFVSNGETVGRYSAHVRLSAPAEFGRVVRLSLSSAAAGVQSTTMLVPLRFHGAAMIGGEIAPAGTRVTVSVARGASGLMPCGAGVVDESGEYTIDVAATPKCADDGNAGGPVRYVFTMKDVNAGAYSAHVRLDDPRTLGRVARIRLAAPGS